MLSRSFHDFPRIGESGTNLLVVKGIDTIDASQIDTDFLGHSYFSEARAVIEDVQAVLCNDLPPANRNLTPKRDHELPYWGIRVP
jgi:hypothetical protein